MKKLWIQLFIVIIGIMFCIVGHNGVKKYIYKNFINKKSNEQLVYYDNLYISSNPYIIELEDNNIVEKISTEISTTKIQPKTSTTTKITSITTRTSTTTTASTTLIKTTEKIIEKLEEQQTLKEEVINNEEKVLDDMTLKELTEKLNKSLNSTLSNTGYYFTNYYKETGLDPYLAVAIVLQETGCKWTCSKLVRECNNIGGMKGTPSCNGGSYKKYDTLEEGINGYLDMLYNNYYSKGLNTPELINPKYAASTTWSEKINNYILEIKSK